MSDEIKVYIDHTMQRVMFERMGEPNPENKIVFSTDVKTLEEEGMLAIAPGLQHLLKRALADQDQEVSVTIDADTLLTLKSTLIRQMAA